MTPRWGDHTARSKCASRPCTAHDMTFGGRCLNCGYDESAMTAYDVAELSRHPTAEEIEDMPIDSEKTFEERLAAITANFREGLSVLQYFISTHGARRGDLHRGSARAPAAGRDRGQGCCGGAAMPKDHPTAGGTEECARQPGHGRHGRSRRAEDTP